MEESNSPQGKAMTHTYLDIPGGEIQIEIYRCSSVSHQTLSYDPSDGYAASMYTGERSNRNRGVSRKWRLHLGVEVLTRTKRDAVRNLVRFFYRPKRHFS